MNPALLFLVWRSFVHGTRTRILRLKNPRYLVPFLLGAAYFGFLFLGPFSNSRGAPIPPHPDEGRRAMLMAEWIGAAFAFLMAAGAWLLPSRRSPLAFLEAEVSILFPAPLTRRELVTYKILEIFKVLLLSGAFIALFVLINSGPLRAASAFANTTVYLGILSIHNVGANLTRRSLLDHGVAGWKRMALPIAVVGGIVAAVVFGAPPFPSFEDIGDAPRSVVEMRLFDWLEALGASPAGWALLPFRILGRPLFSPDLLSLVVSVAMLLPIAALLYWWVVRTDAAFEEAAAEQAADLGRRIEAYRSGKGWRSALGKPGSTRRAPWRLSPEGPPEIAFAWKSAAESVRTFSPRLFGFLIAALIVGLALAKDFAGPQNENRLMATVGACCLAFAGFLVFGGPSFLGSSLRQDLEQVEFLKTIPISPARLVRCSLLG
ncbi:MAG TPA: putative ABC exporter domain-containing protein, partial [Planctomycetota bacterium]|nr:putative ABC exporter domain-containing protein [Planctomycetota bacterium]